MGIVATLEADAPEALAFGAALLDVARSGRQADSMKSKSRVRIYSAFFLKAVLVASLIMFACMAVGELIYDKNLFSGFLHKPMLWVGIFLETSAATLFTTTLGALILSRFRFINKKKFASLSAVVWCFLDLVLISLYSHFYWTREWHLTVVTPGIVFGWILPGLLTLIYFVFLSFELRQV